MIEKWTGEQKFYRIRNKHVHGTESLYFTDNWENNKSYLTLRVQLLFHSIRLAILNFEEYVDKTDNACLLLVKDYISATLLETFCITHVFIPSPKNSILWCKPWRNSCMCAPGNILKHSYSMSYQQKSRNSP